MKKPYSFGYLNNKNTSEIMDLFYRIKKLNVLDVRNKSSKTNKTRMNDIVYKVANQTEYDKYNDQSGENNKLYNMLDRLWNSDGNITISAV